MFNAGKLPCADVGLSLQRDVVLEEQFLRSEEEMYVAREAFWGSLPRLAVFTRADNALRTTSVTVIDLPLAVATGSSSLLCTWVSLVVRSLIMLIECLITYFLELFFFWGNVTCIKQNLHVLLEKKTYWLSKYLEVTTWSTSRQVSLCSLPDMQCSPFCPLHSPELQLCWGPLNSTSVCFHIVLRCEVSLVASVRTRSHRDMLMSLPNLIWFIK